MKKTAAVIAMLVLGLMAQGVNGTTLTFYGVVDVRPGVPSRFPVGTPFYVTVTFQPVSGLITRYDLSVGIDFNIRGTKGGGWVVYDNDPTHGSVYYQIYNSDFMEVTMQAATPGGIIPDCVVDFNLSEFALYSNPLLANTEGHLTSLPIIK